MKHLSRRVAARRQAVAVLRARSANTAAAARLDNQVTYVGVNPCGGDNSGIKRVGSTR
jgi:hypothetical protein